jgi:tRNA nucleotidyltransferase (CCA-adding enzyme)
MISITLQGLKELIPDYVTNIAEELQKNGYQAYLVGGSLRDVLLGIQPNDYDIATNAYPEEIEKIFPRSVPTGAKFGTITVIGEDQQGEKFDVEVTTYRSEADYMGGRWPTKVEFTKTIQEDLARRDFTINAIALNLQEFDTVKSDSQISELVVDPFGGQADLEQKLIKAVGNPVERFTEDGLRPVRGCRLAAQLEFMIDPQTFAAMQQTNNVTRLISVERFREELMKLLMQASRPSHGLRLMQQVGILDIFIPELTEGIDVVQPEFHVDDVFTHTLKAVDAAEDRIKLAALFHDIAKPRTRTIDQNGIHFYGHDQMGAEMTIEIMRRLKFSNAEIEHTSKLVRWHMFYYPSADWRKLRGDQFEYQNADKDEIQKHIKDSRTRKAEGGWSDAAIRRLIINVGGQDAIDDLMRLRIADALANPKSEFNPEEIKVLSERIAEVRAKEMALRIEDLDITGGDIMAELQLEPGPKIVEILKLLLDAVIDNPNLNQKQQLIELAKKSISRPLAKD